MSNLLNAEEIMSKITASTKMTEVFKLIPGLKEYLPKLDKRFEILNSPVAGMILKFATVNDAAGKMNISVEELFEFIKKIINELNAQKSN